MLIGQEWRTLVRALNPFQDGLVLRRIFGPTLAAAVSSCPGRRNALGFGGRDGLAQQQTVLRVRAVDYVHHGLPARVEQGVGGVAIDARVTVFALFLKNGLDVGAKEWFVERLLRRKGRDRLNGWGTGLPGRRKVEGPGHIRRIGRSVQLPRQLLRVLAPAPCDALHGGKGSLPHNEAGLDRKSTRLNSS